MTVAVKKYSGTPESVRRAIDLCGGFQCLKPQDYVLLKPNIFWGGGLFHKSIPQYGLVSTSRIIEDTIIALKEHGCSRIAVGEGSVLDKSLLSSTKRGFKWTGINLLVKKYGIKLIDFYDTRFRRIDLGGNPVNISEAVFECDFLVNMPVLKTHFQAVVSLGMKNLKGCLSMNSKKLFHQINLHELIAMLALYLKPGLTIIDGVYASEKGPGPMSISHRMNAIIAGRDVFSVDIAGSEILGIKAGDVPYLQHYSRITGRPADFNGIDIKGDPVESLKMNMKWDIDFNDYLTNSGLSGIDMRPLTTSICSGCVTGIQCGSAIFSKDSKNIQIKKTVICGDTDDKFIYDNSFVNILYGNCIIKKNSSLTGAFKIQKCPVTTIDVYLSLLKQTSKLSAIRVIITRFFKIIGALAGVYKENLMMKKYNPPEFDANHFR